MKKYILDSCIKYINNNCPQYNEEKLLEIRYGLEGIYLTITKAIIIFSTALILGIFKEMIIILLLYNVLRAFAYGLHATKSWICLVSSLIIFLGAPIIAINLIFPLIIKIIIILFCIISFYLYAPADTEKHPLIKKKKRMIYKYITICIGITYSYLSLYINNQFLSNSFLLAMIIETLFILPISYKIFNLKYNNYKSYILKSS
ncbi:MAG: accessory gene regulator B family protein [Bacilli bacterium]|nr:accessory gene regulator B family protein [Bacilli bacterium]